MDSVQEAIEQAENAHMRAIDRIDELHAMGVYDEKAYQKAMQEAAENHAAAVSFAHVVRDWGA